MIEPDKRGLFEDYLVPLTDDYVEGTKRLYSFFQVQSFIDNVRRAELTMSTHRSPFEILYNFGHMIESGVNIFRL